MRSRQPAPPILTVEEILARWDAVLLDAYGVLNDGAGPLPRARSLLDALEGRPWRVVTNDASRLPESASRRFASWGLEVSPERFLSSGSLIPGWIEKEGLMGARAVVLGPDDSRAWVEMGGCRVLAPGEDVDVVVIADEAGYELGPTVDAVLSALIRQVDRGDEVRLLLPNPDLVFPRRGGYALTAGAVAAVVEAVLLDRYGPRPEHRFVRLGKPAPALFEEARRQLDTDRIVMIGDQLSTDIEGARAAGLGAVLAQATPREGPLVPRPDAVLLWPD